MRSHFPIVLTALLLSLTLASAQASHEMQPPEPCKSMNLPSDISNDETVTIARALDICDDLQKVFASGNVHLKTLQLLQERSEEKPLEADEVERMLQQPAGQSQVLQRFLQELERGRQERDALAQELQDRLTIQRSSAKAAALASDSNRVRLQVQKVLAVQRAFMVETEFKRYQHTKFLNAFLGTTVSTVGTGLQLNSSLHVQHVGDYLGIAGGALTAFFNICTADWNTPDPAPTPPASLLFSTFASDNKIASDDKKDNSVLIPKALWDSLNDKTKAEMKGIFHLYQGNTDIAWAHLSCHWGAGYGPQPPPAAFTASMEALEHLDTDLAKVNNGATQLLQQLALQ